ncbi:hypothetical protein [Alterisphingorhabdus coralli]|uniref:Nuclear transport factor 2 family protein n=1 Tax=Alterisphingorhabdus coralli TaxID=3071408 RepID=A0AA97F9G5_9SPHN|nr:hypothetical protein [Parasphingorhabdus sp. SCSIO 66989]WOE75492.1 hypothetical protein RB602_01905 [Parasphingorhabdus sp. SCSIO 66989]
MDHAIGENFAASMRSKIESKAFLDPGSFQDMLADEVKLFTPRFWSPITDRNWMIGILCMVPQAIENFTYERHWVAGSEVFMEFTGNVGKYSLQGLDIFTIEDDGKIKELTVMVRPPNALEALGAVEDKMLKELFGVATQAEFKEQA